MKNLKSIIPLVSVMFLLTFIYLSTSGFSTSSPQAAIQINTGDAPSTTCQFLIHLETNDPDLNCLTGIYKYCINGGPTASASGDFYVTLNCDQRYTICVEASNGCTGTIEIEVVCPCRSVQTRTVILSSGGSLCNCS